MAKKINFDENVLKEYINNFKLANGYYPKYNNFDVSKGSPYSRNYLEKKYNGINNMYSELNISRKDKNRSSFSESKVIEYISNYKVFHNEYPRAIDFDRDCNSPYCFNTLLNKYGNLQNCYNQLGFIDNNVSIKNIEVDEQLLVEYIENHTMKTGFKPSLNDFYKKLGSPYSKMVLIKHYGSINNMYIKLGYEINTVRKCETSKEELLSSLIECIYKYRTTDRDELRNLSCGEIKDRSVYERVFGSWTNAVLESGFKNENRVLMAEYPDYNGENPIEFLKIKIGKNGSLTKKQIDLLSGTKISNYFINKYFLKKDFYLILSGKDIQWKSMQPIKRIAIDGHVCDSNEEKIVDNYLHLNSIEHEVHGRYPNSARKFDFKVNDIYIEYAGLMKSNYKKHDKYKIKIQEKIEFANINNLKLFILYDTSKKSLNEMMQYIGGFTE